MTPTITTTPKESTMPADPITPTLAERWRPMWHPWAHQLRPWWRKAENRYSSLGSMFGSSGASRPLEAAWQRVDGCVVLGWAFLNPEAAKAAKADADRHTESGLWATAEEAMAYVDAASPIPAPDPMPGQVWAFPGSGIERTIVDVTGGAGWFMFQPGAPFSVGGPYSCHARPEMLRADEWPPPGAVLVAGPTPWGRDVPWAPTGGA